MSFALLLIIATPVLFMSGCGKKNTTVHVDGFYVKHVLISFPDEFYQLRADGFEPNRYHWVDTLVATNNETKVERPFWGTGGLYEEMTNALRPLSGQDALNKFDEFIQKYNDDPGMFDPVYAKGYLISLQQSLFVPEFEQLSRVLFGGQTQYEPNNNFNPNNSIGNAFMPNEYWSNGIEHGIHKQGELGYAITDFGIHIIIVSGLSTR